MCKKNAGSTGYSNSTFYHLPCLMLTTSNKLQLQASITVKLCRTLIPPKNLYPLSLTTNLLIVSHQLAANPIIKLFSYPFDNSQVNMNKRKLMKLEEYSRSYIIGNTWLSYQAPFQRLQQSAGSKILLFSKVQAPHKRLKLPTTSQICSQT